MLLKNSLTDNETGEKKRNNWSYFFHCIYSRVEVFQFFRLQLSQISKKRISSVQQKLFNNKSINDEQGTHLQQVLKSKNEVE